MPSIPYPQYTQKVTHWPHLLLRSSAGVTWAGQEACPSSRLVQLAGHMVQSEAAGCGAYVPAMQCLQWEEPQE